MLRKMTNEKCCITGCNKPAKLMYGYDDDRVFCGLRCAYSYFKGQLNKIE